MAEATDQGFGVFSSRQSQLLAFTGIALLYCALLCCASQMSPFFFFFFNKSKARPSASTKITTCFIVGVWNGTCSVSGVCLYRVTGSS